MKDLITDFFKTLNIETADSFDEILDNVSDAFGEEAVANIENIVYSQPHEGQDAELFEYINTTPALSVMVFGGVDGGFYRKLFRNIQKNRQFLGKDILVLDGSCPIAGCFLGKMLPESHITCACSAESFTSVGEALAEQLGLSNIEFTATDIRKLTGKYDTVLCSRVSEQFVGSAREDIDFDGSNHQIAGQYERLYTEYARRIKSLLNDGGSMISVDTIPYTMGMYGLYSAFARMNIAPDLGTYLRLIYISLGEREAIPFVCCRMGTTDMTLMEQFFDEVFIRETEQDDSYYDNKMSR